MNKNMTAQHAGEMLRRVAAVEGLVRGAATSAPATWRWRPGTLLFPEGLCPYCRQAIRSNRIWMVDGQVLKGQLRLELPVPPKGDSLTNLLFKPVGRLVFERPDHPHADSGGGLCLGDVRDADDDPLAGVARALFLGLNPSDPITYRDGFEDWLSRMFDHRCGGEAIGEMVIGGGTVAREVVASNGGPRAGRPRPSREDAGRWCQCGCSCYQNDPDGCGCGCETCRCDDAWCTSDCHCPDCRDNGDCTCDTAIAAARDEQIRLLLAVQAGTVPHSDSDDETF